MSNKFEFTCNISGTCTRDKSTCPIESPDFFIVCDEYYFAKKEAEIKQVEEVNEILESEREYHDQISYYYSTRGIK